MVRRRRPRSRASVVDGRARLTVPVEAISTAGDEPMSMGDIANRLPKVASMSAPLASAPAVSLVLDRFAYDLHLSDVGHATDVHDGDDFVTATRSGVELRVVDGLDPLRSSDDDLDAAARDGRMLGGVVQAFEVDHLSE